MRAHVAVLVVTFLVGGASAEERSGLTLEATVGFAYERVFSDEMTLDAGWGFAPVSLGIGGFVNRDLALFGEVRGVMFEAPSSVMPEEEVTWIHLGAGPAAQIWLGAKSFVAVGGGVALLGTLDDGIPLRPGFDAFVRGGYLLGTDRLTAMFLVLSAYASGWDGGTAAGATLGLQIQRL